MNESNKDALIESLRRKIKKLEDENKQLRDQLKVAYAEVFKKILVSIGEKLPSCLSLYTTIGQIGEERLHVLCRIIIDCGIFRLNKRAGLTTQRSCKMNCPVIVRQT